MGKPSKFKNIRTVIDGLILCCVDGCGNPAKYHLKGKNAICGKHYQRNMRWGDPKLGRAENGEPMEWLKINSNTDRLECLMWPFGRMSNGYGSFKSEQYGKTPHRAMCFIAHGAPPSNDMHAAHSCGKGHEGCVNPNHLRWATPSQNQNDRVLHGTDNRGEKHYRSKLTKDDVDFIRKSKGFISEEKLASMLNVSRGTISCVVQRRTWKPV